MSPVDVTICKKSVKYLRITIKRDGRVLVTAPRYCSDVEITRFVEKKRAWVTKKCAELSDRQWPVLADDEVVLFGDIYRLVSGGEIEIDTEKSLLVATAKQITSLWKEGVLRLVATNFLSKQCALLAEQHGLSYRCVSIKNQTSRRWSCSSRKNINLNRKLIQLPQWVSDYVICHELAHLVHMNHSPRFWSLCRSLYPRTDDAKARLKKHGMRVL